jgi:hypothetical protein
MNKVFGADLMGIVLLLFIFIVGLFVTGMFGICAKIEKIEEARGQASVPIAVL